MGVWGNCAPEDPDKERAMGPKVAAWLTGWLCGQGGGVGQARWWGEGGAGGHNATDILLSWPPKYLGQSDGGGDRHDRLEG